MKYWPCHFDGAFLCPLTVSIDNKQSSPRRRTGTMRLGIIGYLVAHARLQHKGSHIIQFSIQLAVQAQQDMPLRTPMVSQITGGILHHSDAHITEHARTPECNAAVPFMLCLFYC